MATIEVDIVIVSWTKTEKLRVITQNCIKSCIKSDPTIKFNFYVVETNKKISYAKLGNVKMIYFKGKYGYHKCLNLGIKAGKSKYLCLCNNDLTFEENWATNIIERIEHNPEIKSASPFCPQTQSEFKLRRDRIYIGHRVRNEINGWCIFQQRSIYEIIGKLDERFIFWYCDNDYSETLKKHNIVHALIPNSVVNHHYNTVGETGNHLPEIEKQKMTFGQEEIFNKKWIWQ
jgi:GT2 family glycosyltransferase